MIDDLTPFRSFNFYCIDSQGQWLQTVVTRGTFEILGDGRTRVATDQPPLPHFDTYYGDPKIASLRSEHCRIPLKPRGEVYFVDPVSRVLNPERNWSARVTIGPIDVHFRLWGPRQLYRNFMGMWRTSEPKAVAELPIRFEFAYGGGPNDKRALETNPVGTGYGLEFYDISIRELAGPQIEFWDSHSRNIPAALSPIHRAWLPRRKFAGSFDDAWRESKAPLFPDDFDDQFYLQSSSFLQLPEGYFVGNETVRLENIGRSGINEFQLSFPQSLSLVAFDDGNNPYSAKLFADTLVFDLESNRLTVEWRATFYAVPNLVELNVYDPENDNV